MDLIPPQFKQQSTQPPHAELQSGLKSRGISLSGKKTDLSFLMNKWSLVSFGGLVLALLLWGAIFYLDYGVQKTIKGLDSQISTLQAAQASQQNSELIKKTADIDKIVSMVKSLQKSHIYASLFFEQLQKATLPQVQWSGLNLDASVGTADLRGMAGSYSILADQIVSFQNAKFGITVSGIALTEGGVSFSAKIKFDRKILLKQ